MEQSSRFHFDSFTFFIGFGLGSFLGVALALVAIALVQRSDASDANQDPRAFVIPTQQPLPPGTTATPDARPRTRTAVDVHLGPGGAFAVVGIFPRGEAVDVVGRDADSQWVAIRFPPGSTARGWVLVSNLEGVAGLDRLSVVLPTPLPRSVTIPNFPFENGDGGPPPRSTPEAGSGGGPIVTPTPRLNLGPVDLVVNRISLLSDGRVRVVVGNTGPGDLLEQQVNVLVRDIATRSELIISSQRGLEVGDTVTLTSSFFTVRSELEVHAIADPSGNVNDPNRSNNFLSVTLSPAPTPTATPTPIGGRGSGDDEDD
ncbi:MAG: hypothetical protein GEU75_08600 [Dehalococcoidia bacterium]|nr:hypothetical protein [Dehalococcoidia bacterium]